MRFVHPEIDVEFDTGNGKYNTLVIENRDMLYRVIMDIANQLCGRDGEAVLSMDDHILRFNGNAELLENFAPFDFNRKTLVSRITAAIEQTVLSAEYYERTIRLLHEAEALFSDAAFEYPCDIIFPRLTASSLLKAMTPQIRETTDILAEQLLDYMELVTEFDHTKLFITLNLRSFINDEQMESFTCTAVEHGYHLLSIENREYARLSTEKRVIVDEDLCVIA